MSTVISLIEASGGAVIALLLVNRLSAAFKRASLFGPAIADSKRYAKR